MNSISLAAASIKARPLQTALCMIASAAGIALLSLVLLFSNSIENGIMRNMRGIDMVVGAKGSPLQLILSTVFHADVPNGNIEQKDAQTIIKNPQIAKAIPMAIGDSYKGFRVVGTTNDYLNLFDAEFAQGKSFEKNFEAVAGANVNVKLGDEFAAVHGLSIDSDDVHDFHLYRVTGILKPTGTVLDRLIVTNIGSVQELHSHPDHDEHEHHDHDEHEEEDETALSHQVTALLVKVRSPVAVMNLPRSINHSTNMLAVSPSYELARFSQAMGISRDVLLYLGAGFMILSGLVLLSSLSSSLALRRYDLGILRSMGASRAKIWATVMSEGLLIATMGSILGLVIGHISAYALASNIPSLKGIILPTEFLKIQINDLYLLALGIVLGLAAGLIPAYQASKTNVSDLLSKGRI